MPDGWVITGGCAAVEMRNVDRGGRLAFYTTDAHPSKWDRGGELFHGHLYGVVGVWPNQKKHGWKLWCVNVSVYIYYSWETYSDLELAEVHEIVFSLSPTKWI